MSVIVLGMEMPASCRECIDRRLGFRTYFGCIKGTVAPSDEERLPDCPLHPLPEKHGRLIDLDALLDRINGEERPEMYDGMDEVFWIQKCLEEATAIVESEGEYG